MQPLHHTADNDGFSYWRQQICERVAPPEQDEHLTVKAFQGQTLAFLQ